MAIFNLGSVNIDHVYQVPHFVRPGETLASLDYARVLGGKGANQSLALAKAGASVKHIGQMHTADEDFWQQIQQTGVDCEYLHKSSTPSGHAIIQVIPEGENAIVLFGGANQAIEMGDIEAALQGAGGEDWFLTQNETSQVPEALAYARKQGLKTAYNPAPACGIEKQVNPADVDLLVVNQTEAEAITGLSDLEQQVDYFADNWAHAMVVLTLGGEGALLICDKGILQVSAFETEVVDTTAAGDTFIGFFLAALSRNESEQDAIQQACAAAALSVQKAGASTSIPSLDEVDDFLAEVTE